MTLQPAGLLWHSQAGQDHNVSACCGAAQQVDYEAETLLVASKHGRIIGGATLARCPRGVVVKEVGALEGLGGGTALLAAAASFARRNDAVYLLLSPVDSDAARFWGRGGFYPLHWGWFAYNRCPERHSELAARLHHEADGLLTEEESVAAAKSFADVAGEWHCNSVLWLEFLGLVGSWQRRRRCGEGQLSACHLLGVTLQAKQASLEAGRSAGLPADELAPSVQRLEELQRREEANKALEEAMRQGTTEDLREALTQAELAGVGDLLLDDAPELLHRCEQQSQATQSLQVAAISGGMAELRAALCQGQVAGLPANSMAAASGKLAELEEEEQEAERQRELERQAMLGQARRDHATEILAEACRSRDVSSLQTAIDAAHKAGLDGHGLEQATKLLAEVLEEAKQASARQTLQEALVTRSREALQEAVRQGKAARLPSKELEAARAALGAEDAKARAHARLQLAIQAKDIVQLRGAIATTERSGLTAEEMRAAKDMLRELENKELQRNEEASKALQEAMRQGTIEDLREALTRAELAGVGDLLLDDARELLHRCEQQSKATQSLQLAVISGGMAELRAALCQGQVAGLPANSMAAAWGKLAELEEEEQEAERQRELERQAMLGQARRDHATEILAEACRSRDVSSLQTAIDAAHKAGLDGHGLEQATKLLAEVLEEAKQASARQTLQEALVTRSREALQEAVRQGKAARLPSKELEAARAALGAEDAKARAHARLQLAIQAKDIVQLRGAIATTERSGLTAEEMRAAKDMLRELENKELQRNEEASKALQEAMRQGTIEDLREALTRAELAGVGDLLLDNARELLHRCEQQSKATQSLQVAAISGGMAELRAAICQGQVAGLPANSMAAASGKLAELEEEEHEAERQRELERQAMLGQARRDHATEILAEACRSRDVSSLQTAIDAAHKAGLDGHGLEQATKLLAEVLEEAKQASARQTLQEALVTRSREALQEAVRQGKAARLPSKELEAARAALGAEDAKARAHARLQLAIQAKDIVQLRGAIATTERSGLTAEEMRAAKDMLRELENKAARKALLDAEAGDSIPHLQAALEAGRSAGLRADELAPSVRRLEELQRNEEASKALQEAMRQRTIEDLREALTRAELAGVGAPRLDDARELLHRCEQQSKATQSLQLAVISGGMAELRAAICQGQVAGLPADSMAAASGKLAELEEEEQEAERQRELERQAARKALLDAEAGDSIPHLQAVAALEAGRSAGLRADALAPSVRRLEELQRNEEASKALQEAMRQGTIEDLREALTRAELAGVGAPRLDDARELLRRREQQSKATQGLQNAVMRAAMDAAHAKAAARSLLESALASDDVERLREALRRGELAKLEDAEMGACRRALVQAEARARAALQVADRSALP
ncbi:unnamed protein product [Symbiodinium sp. CCMP2592]|nr:unnamed protein product [Symbiodinium sp. CCMP2592]